MKTRGATLTGYETDADGQKWPTYEKSERSPWSKECGEVPIRAKAGNVIITCACGEEVRLMGHAPEST